MAERERWTQVRVVITRGAGGSNGWVTVVVRHGRDRTAIDRRLMTIPVEWPASRTGEESVRAAIRNAVAELLQGGHLDLLP